MCMMYWYQTEGNPHLEKTEQQLFLRNTGCPKKMFPCLRGYNSCKKGATVKSKESFVILRQFSFWWTLKFLHLDHLSLRKWGLKIATLLLKLWQKQLSSDLNFFAILSDGSPCIFFTLVKVNENLTAWMRISILTFVLIEDAKTKILLAIPAIGFEILQMCIKFICCHLNLFQM